MPNFTVAAAATGLPEFLRRPAMIELLFLERRRLLRMLNRRHPLDDYEEAIEPLARIAHIAMRRIAAIEVEMASVPSAGLSCVRRKLKVANEIVREGGATDDRDIQLIASAMRDLAALKAGRA